MKNTRKHSSATLTRAKPGSTNGHPRGAGSSNIPQAPHSDAGATPAHQEIHAEIASANGGHGVHTADWSLLSPEGHVIFLIALCPNATIKEVASALDRTERSVWGIIQRLRNEGMVQLRRKGRKHHYSIKLDAPLLHPTIKGLTLRPVMEDAIERARTEAPELCDEIHAAGRKNGGTSKKK